MFTQNLNQNTTNVAGLVELPVKASAADLGTFTGDLCTWRC